MSSELTPADYIAEKRSDAHGNYLSYWHIGFLYLDYRPGSIGKSNAVP
jgi:hypothetical protein